LDSNLSCQRILTTPDHGVNNWLHGHHSFKRGAVVYYNNVQLAWSTQGTVTDWSVVCGKSGSTAPNNCIINGVASGINNGGGTNTTGNQIAINVFSQENSDFAFSQLFIWNTVLTDAELLIVSNALQQHLLDGVSFTNAL
jgi:hypothetical protein